MKADTYPLQVLLWALSGWVNRHQQDVIAYLVEENRVLKEQLGGRRLRHGGVRLWYPVHRYQCAVGTEDLAAPYMNVPVVQMRMASAIASVNPDPGPWKLAEK